jgi:hypothetical protein
VLDSDGFPIGLAEPRLTQSTLESKDGTRFPTQENHEKVPQ